MTGVKSRPSQSPQQQPFPRLLSTWQEWSRLIGVVILLGLFTVYMAGWKRDTTVTLAFLGVATALLGLPAGWRLIKGE